MKCMKIKNKIKNCLNFLTLVVFSYIGEGSFPVHPSSPSSSLGVLVPTAQLAINHYFLLLLLEPPGETERVRPVRSVHRSIPLLIPIFEKLLNSAFSTLSLPQFHDRLSSQ